MTRPWRWFKGNLHTHTTNSDGDSPLEDVAGWYRGRGYHFLAITDHDQRTDPDALNRLFAGAFLLLPAEEVTAGYRAKPIHINGLGLRRAIPPRFEDSALATLESNTLAVREQGAVACLNHPQVGWAVSPEELAVAETPELFEVFNGGHRFDPVPPGLPQVEEAWDRWLAAGKRIWGVAADDAHRLQVWGDEYPNPGRGWVQARAAELTESAILAALREGDFYASTGVELIDVRREDGALAVEIEDSEAEIVFVGRGGEILARGRGSSVHRLDNGDGYVRAVVTNGDGAKAWTQPAFESA